MADESDINRSCVVFVVDTEHYSGNFERPLASYLTMWDVDQDNDYICCDKNGEEIMEGDAGYLSSVGVPWPEWFGDNNDGHSPSILFSDTPFPKDFKGRKTTCSVGVCFDKLTKEQIAILTERAIYFCDHARKLSGKSYVAEKIPMIGVRCFKRKVRRSKDEVYDGD